MGAERKTISIDKYREQRNLLREVRSNIKHYEEKTVNELIQLHSSAKRLQSHWTRLYYIGLVGFILIQGIMLILLAIGYNHPKFVVPSILLGVACLIVSFLSIPIKQKHRIVVAHAEMELSVRREIR